MLQNVTNFAFVTLERETAVRLAHLSVWNLEMTFEKLRLFLALVWWRICRFLVDFLYVKSLRPADQFLHKVVVIGDDFAAGVGDYVTMASGAGIAQHLKPLVKHSDKV